MTREDQWRALLPHTIKKDYPSCSVDKGAEKIKRFTPEEVQIRDTYDVFLEYLQRFGNFVQADLVSAEELKPYLFYWIQSIAEDNLSEEDGSNEDNIWKCVLLCYINFYNFSAVVYLFDKFGFNISYEAEIFCSMREKLINKNLYEKLLNSLKPKTEYSNRSWEKKENLFVVAENKNPKRKIWQRLKKLYKNPEKNKT